MCIVPALLFDLAYQFLCVLGVQVVETAVRSLNELGVVTVFVILDSLSKVCWDIM